jgi:hypothetical protein
MPQSLSAVLHSPRVFNPKDFEFPFFFLRDRQDPHSAFINNSAGFPNALKCPNSPRWRGRGHHVFTC